MAHSHGAYQGAQVTCHYNSNLVRPTDWIQNVMYIRTSTCKHVKSIPATGFIPVSEHAEKPYANCSHHRQL